MDRVKSGSHGQRRSDSVLYAHLMTYDPFDLSDTLDQRLILMKFLATSASR